MSTTSTGAESAADARASAGRAWGRRVVTFLAAVLTLLVAVIVVGVFIPSTNFVSVIGTIFISFFTLHVFLAGLVAILLGLWARSLGGRTGVVIILLIAILATVGATVPIISLVRAADRYGAKISWSDHLRVVAAGPRAMPDQTKLFATVDGKKLYLDVYLPASSAARGGASVMAVTGDGHWFVGGSSLT